jgi:hypothetical protein
MTEFKKRRSWQWRQAAAPLAILLAASQLPHAYAAIVNTVTATGTAPGGPVGGVTANDGESVDVADDAPTIAVVKTFTFAPGGDLNGNGSVDPGDIVAYTYTVTNNGNVTLQNVSLADAHDGVGAALAIVTPTTVTTDAGSAPAGTLNDSADSGSADNDWDTLGPGDVITFTSIYTVVPGDLIAATSNDGDIDSTVTATGNYNPGTGNIVVNANSSVAVPLTITPSLQVAKVADDATDVVAGQLITYTYTVTNNGNVPISNVALADTHNGTAGALVPAFQSFTTNTGSTNTGNTITILQPGDVAIYTASYTVTQNDIDTRQ